MSGVPMHRRGGGAGIARTRLPPVSIARHEPSHCLTGGLFRSLQRGARRHGKLDVTYLGNPGEKIRFVGFEPLGVDDMRVLQGLVAMAGAHGAELPPDPREQCDRQLRLHLQAYGDAVEDAAIVVVGSYRALAVEIGYRAEGGSMFASLRRSIHRLWAVSITIEKDGTQRGFRLLSDYASDGNTGRFRIALNPRMARALSGDSKYVGIDMAEVRKLKTDGARLLHQRLCGWVDQGKTRRVAIDTLCEYIWHEKPVSKDAEKKRRKTARKAVNELSVLGWEINEYELGKFWVGRPHREPKWVPFRFPGDVVTGEAT